MEFWVVVAGIAAGCALVAVACRVIARRIRRSCRQPPRENRCVICGDIIPEGLMVCLKCEDKVMGYDR